VIYRILLLIAGLIAVLMIWVQLDEVLYELRRLKALRTPVHLYYDVQANEGSTIVLREKSHGGN